MKTVVENVQKLREDDVAKDDANKSKDGDTKAEESQESKKTDDEQSESVEAEKIVLSETEKAAAHNSKDRAIWEKSREHLCCSTKGCSTIDSSSILTRIWDMTASLATTGLPKSKRVLYNSELARKVYETAIAHIRSLESTFWNESFTDAEKTKLALIEVEHSILDDLKSENTRIATDWSTHQEAVRKIDTWLNRYLPGYDYAHYRFNKAMPSAL